MMNTITIKRKIIEVLCHLSIIVLLILMVGLIGFLFYRGFSAINLSLFFGELTWKEALIDQLPIWEGIWPAIIGTCSLVALTIMIAFMPGVGCGIFIACYASTSLKKILVSIVNILAGIPSIVMGLFGFLIIILLRQWLFPNANTNLILSAVCLSILILPVIIISTQEAIENIPTSITVTLTSLGFTKHQMIRKMLLPLASKGVLSGVILSIGRASEDTAVIMLTGVVANSGLSATIFDKFEALPFHIFVISAEYQSAEELSQGFASAIILVILSVGLFSLAGLLEWWYQKRWQKNTPQKV